MSSPHSVVHLSLGRKRTLLSTTLCLSLLATGGAWAQSAPPAEDWCDHVAAGPAGTLPPPVALAGAHAQVRFFGTGATYVEADLALASALEGATVDWDAAALAYAAALEPACALDVVAASLPPAQVLSRGTLAYIRPGTGSITLPQRTRAVVIDLRGLPAVPGLDAALAQAIGAASSAPVARVPSRMRGHNGMTDELSPTGGVYANAVLWKTPPPYAPTGAAELPVALLTGPTLAPAAARFAVDLRLAQRAWLVGEPVTTAVAEARWLPIGARGLAVRTEHLEDAQGMVPDVIPADLPHAFPAGDPDALEGLRDMADQGFPGPVDRTLPAQRSKVIRRTPINEPRPPLAASSGIARADLLIVHGATRLFFTYFPVVGDGIDGRLLETLASVDARPVTDRPHLLRLLRRFNEVLKDGHGFAGLLGPSTPPAGHFPVALEQVAGEPVIRRSLAPGINPGDTLVSVAGRPISEWLAEEKAHASAATPGYLHDVAMRRIYPMQGPTVFGVRGVDGTTRTVEVQPQPMEVLLQVGFAPSQRASGSLVDLGAPLLHYINLSDEVTTSAVAFRQALAAASGAMGLVVDMRGYPGVNPYELAARLIPETFYSPLYRYPRHNGPDQFLLAESFFPIQPLTNPSYAGPIVLLVGPATVSAAETFSTMLTAAGRATVIGRRSAGTNGNITRVSMPGVVYSMFTGMQVLNPDRSRFHGVGIVPQIEVEPTAADIAEGRDTELLRAIQFLQTGQ